MSFDGLPWERVFKKILTEKNREIEVRDIQSELQRIKEQSGDLGPLRLFCQTEEEHNLLMKQRRANAFTLYKCMPEIGAYDPETKRINADDEIFSLTFDQAIEKGRMVWAQKYPREYVNLLNWSESNPIKLSEHKLRAFYLCGTHRTGKSTFAKLMALKIFDNETVQNRQRTGLVKFVTVDNLINTYLRASSEDKERMEIEIMGVKYLFLDDFGNHHSSNWKETRLLDWIGRRVNNTYRDGKKVWTFFTSNYRINDLGIDIGVSSRIEDCAKEIVIGNTLLPKYKESGNKNSAGGFLNDNPTYS